MRAYDLLLLDADMTLLDFRRAEANAFAAACGAFSLPAGEEALALYSAINLACWKRYERGELTQQALRVARFAEFLRETGGGADPEALSALYERELSHQGCAMPGAAEAVGRWKAILPLLVVTNGIGEVQRGRFARSPFPFLAEGMLISGETGAAKPDPAMVRMAMARAGVRDPRRVLFLGDSITSDIACANNASVDACWFNPEGWVNLSPAHPRYEIRSLDEVDALLLDGHME